MGGHAAESRDGSSRARVPQPFLRQALIVSRIEIGKTSLVGSPVNQ